MQGTEKVNDKDIVFSTWQSIFKLNEKWFSSFDVVIVDECHHAKAASIKSIMEKLKDCKYRIGMTGTLDGSQTHQLILEGLFGPVKKIITTKQLMDVKSISPLSITSLTFVHPQDECKKLKNCTYQEEIDFLVNCDKRNEAIAKLAVSLKGNTLVLYQFVEKHGQVLYDKISSMKDTNVFFVHGKVESEDRNVIRKQIEGLDESITVASFGTFSTRNQCPKH